MREVPDWLNGQEFYELMQAYRHAPMGGQANVVAAFNATKQFIASKLTDSGKECLRCSGIVDHFADSALCLKCTHEDA